MVNDELEGDIYGIFVFMAVVFILWLYSLSLLFNSTYIIADDKKLSITSKPFFGLGKKEIPREEIKNIYVKETKKSKKNGYYYVYELRVITTKKWDNDTKIFPNTITQNEKTSQFIEKRLKTFFKIEDRAVEGNYDFEEKTEELRLQKERKRQGNKRQHSLEKLQKGNFVDYKGSNWEVVYALQFDWENQQSEFLYQLKNQSEFLQLYIKKQTDTDLPSVYLETKVDYFEFVNSHSIPDNIDDLPSIIKFQEVAFYKKNNTKGNVFPQNQSAGIPTKQIRYLTANEMTMLRIMKQESTISITIGSKKEENELHVL